MSDNFALNNMKLTEQLGSLRALVNNGIESLEIPFSPENLYAPLRYFLSLGGKRTRPTLSLLACKMFGENAEKAIKVALAIELFHNFSLIHDDIMDNAPLRRGKPTVHKKWNEHIAILSGDVLYTKAFIVLSQNDPQFLPALFAVFNATAKEVCEGQQLDMDFETKTDVTIDDYIEMIRLKTSVLLGAALEMGAIIANASESDRKLIYEFGVNIGLAFQLQDDILDLYANPDHFGKQVGGDILSNKKTFLFLKAYELADKTQKIQLNEAFSSAQDNKVEEVRAIFDQLNVKKHAEDLQQLFYQDALSKMDAISVNDEQKEDLLELAKQLMTRNS